MEASGDRSSELSIEPASAPVRRGRPGGARLVAIVLAAIGLPLGLYLSAYSDPRILGWYVAAASTAVLVMATLGLLEDCWMAGTTAIVGIGGTALVIYWCIDVNVVLFRDALAPFAWLCLSMAVAIVALPVTAIAERITHGSARVRLRSFAAALPKAALLYQAATSQGDSMIADYLGERMMESMSREESPPATGLA